MSRKYFFLLSLLSFLAAELLASLDETSLYTSIAKLMLGI